MLRAWTTLALIPIPHLNPTTPTSNLNQKLRGMDDLVTALEMYHPGDGFQLRVLRQTAGEGIGAAFPQGAIRPWTYELYWEHRTAIILPGNAGAAILIVFFLFLLSLASDHC